MHEHGRRRASDPAKPATEPPVPVTPTEWPRAPLAAAARMPITRALRQSCVGDRVLGRALAQVAQQRAGRVVQRVDQRAEAKLPTADQQATLRGHLDPNTRQQPHLPHPSSNTPVPWDGEEDQPDHEAHQRALRKEMFVALDDFRTTNDPDVQRGKSARRVPMTQAGGQHGDTGVLGIAQRAQAAISARFGPWIQNGVRSQTGKQPMTSIGLRAGQEIVDAGDQAQHKQALGVGDTAYAGDPGWWAARNHHACREVLAKHHWTPDGHGKGFLQWVVGLWLDTADNRAWMADYHTFRISEHARNAIILDTAIEPRGHRNPEAAERAKRWSLFGTSVHELMHGCAHPAFVAATRSRPVMHEGFTEYFAGQVSAPLVEAAAAGQDEGLRRAVEGSVATLLPDGIAPYHTPSAYGGYVAEVEAMKRLIGEEAVLAAFFQGHVEFLGLGPDGTPSTDVRPDKGEPPLRVPPGMNTLSNLAWRTNVNMDLLKYANKSRNLQEDISMHAKLVLPDCREHIVVDAEGTAETLEHIARQHGTSKASIMDANPDRPVVNRPSGGATWAALKAGDRILIPKRW